MSWRRFSRRMSSWMYGYDPALPVEPKEISSICQALSEDKRLLTLNILLVTPWLVVGFGLFLYFIGRGQTTANFAIGAACAFGLFTIGQLLTSRWLYARLIRKELRRCGHNLCTKCGHWLQGLEPTTDRCPECGTLREISPG